MIYNTTTSKAEFYNGSAWVETGGIDAFLLEYLVVAGGGGGGSGRNLTSAGSGGGGGAGGLNTSVSGSSSGGGSSADPTYYGITGVNYVVSIGGGGTAPASGSEHTGERGTNSEFAIGTVQGGGGGYGRNGTTLARNVGGSGGGTGGSIYANLSNIQLEKDIEVVIIPLVLLAILTWVGVEEQVQ